MLDIRNGSVLVDGAWLRSDIGICEGAISLGRKMAGACSAIDASGLLVLPGIVDMHGDAFERQIMPRPGVAFDLETALLDTDRQLIANGITTAFHGVTCSWEPGLRSIASTRAMLEASRKLRRSLVADTRIHLRHEVFNLGHEDEIIKWMRDGFIHALAFNDHTRGIVKAIERRATKIEGMVQRSGLSFDDFIALVHEVIAREPSVQLSVDRLAEAARARSIPLLSHDDRDIADRQHYRGLGCLVSEFPMTRDTAAAAIEDCEDTVFGAPNVLRNGSHIGCPSAADMVAQGLCTILASDYYYPSLLEAPFLLARNGAAELADAWSLVSSNPARAMGLPDRGRIAEGRRGDVVLVDNTGSRPRLVATIVAGTIAWLADFGRLRSQRAA
ncbi:MAG: amidohydrolase family protein [Hyphomicrobiales bacterium]|nr:amidohydrolase family protein [Hyphomicrobiales bacterium]